ncbi:MAG: serine hydrolase [Candidatus Heimdallarchaeota archaeon]|nr:serine hydrolase [Candidatus Heimdallarchaeota archaeon]
MHKIRIGAILALTIIILLGGFIIYQNQNQPVDMEYWPTTEWRISTPSNEGMDTDLLNHLINEIETGAHGVKSMLIIRNGNIVSEYYQNDIYQTLPQNVFSVTKSVTSSLIGIALDKLLISSLDLTLGDIFTDHSMATNESIKKSISIENLLKMDSGISWSEIAPFDPSNLENNYIQMIGSQDWVQYVLDLPMFDTPGSSWMYNTGGSHLLSVILSEYTNVNAEEFARINLFDKIGISSQQFYWEVDPDGSSNGGSALHLTARDMARFGYLFLKSGIWEGETIISSSYISQAINPIWTVDSSRNYGYQWWVDGSGEFYYAAGYQGQYIFISPENNLLVVFQSSSSTYPHLGFMHNYILPSILD